MAHGHSGGTERPVAEHLAAVIALASTRVDTAVPVREAVGRIVASDTIAQRSVPAFDNSAMDGFLVHAADVAGAGPWPLPVAGDIPAGSLPIDVPAGHAVRIMTGAPCPAGDDLIVVPVENTNIPRGPVPLPEQVTINEADTSRDHIRREASNMAPGDVVVRAGSRLDAGTLAALISLGVDTVDVYRAPTVAVISTGEELVESAAVASRYQIPDSNRPMLAELARANGAGEVLEFHAGDSNDDFRTLLDEASARADIVVTSGGVSVGAFDVVRAVTEPSGDMWFGPVAQRPGEPQGCGRWNGAALVCLPGNPVAAFNSFHLYVVPLLHTMAGHPAPAAITDRPHTVISVGPDFPAPHKPVTLMVPVRVDFTGENVSATPFNSHGPGSHLVGSLADTNGLAIVSYGGDAGEPREITVLLTRT